jgi:glycine cleavage system aminomethyltransferase T
MQDARGKVKRRLVVLGVDGAGDIAAGAAIERPSGEAVGRVTSSASARAGERYALGMVGAPDFEPGTVLAVSGSPARVVARAFETVPAEPPNARQTV